MLLFHSKVLFIDDHLMVELISMFCTFQMHVLHYILCSPKKNNFKQHISILKDGASGEQVGDIETIIVKNLFKLL